MFYLVLFLFSIGVGIPTGLFMFWFEKKFFPEKHQADNRRLAMTMLLKQASKTKTKKLQT